MHHSKLFFNISSILKKIKISCTKKSFTTWTTRVRPFVHLSELFSPVVVVVFPSSSAPKGAIHVFTSEWEEPEGLKGRDVDGDVDGDVVGDR